MYNHLNKNKHLILTLPLFLAAALFIPAHVLPSANAQFTGTVCVVFPSTNTSCPSSSPTYGPLSNGQTFTVGVFVSGSDAMGGFDVYVSSDPSVIMPVSAALGTLIASPSLTSICVNGSAQTGSCTVGTANGAGVVEVTTIESSGSNECGGTSPCSGLAFTITYQVVSVAASSTLGYPTAPGCSTSSVSSPSNVCVLIDDAFGTTLPEMVQTPGATITQTVQTITGVCITYPSTATSCHSPPPLPISTTFGATFTVGVWVQSSPPVGGFDIYVSSDPHFLNPTDASLGTLITTPTNTNICVDGVSTTGACTVNSANGPGVVEVSTVESSGSNDPGTGLAFTVTYQVVGVTPNTAISYPTNPACSTTSNSTNSCVLVADAFGNAIPEGIYGAAVGQVHVIDTSGSLISCSPSPVVVGISAFCIATVSDSANSGAVAPVGGVTFTTDGFGAYTPSFCTLQPINSFQSQCNTSYEPLHVGSGTSNLGVIYDPVHPPPFNVADAIHQGSTGSTPLTVMPATAAISSAVIVSQTGLPPPGGIAQLGQSVHDNAFMVAGSGFPVTGATGMVSYVLYTNNGCTGTFTSVSNSTVQSANNVAPSTSQTLAAGNYAFQAIYRPDTTDNVQVVSACEPFSVSPYPAFTSGKLHWTHHLSLSKSANAQSWSAIVNNPLSTSVTVLIRIVGSSAINPSLNFDVTCGAVCVATAVGGVNATNSTLAGPITIASGATVTFSFSQSLPSSFANAKFSFTATVWWSNGSDYAPGTSKSGSFAVTP